jgi:hypothetical protein
MNKLRTCIAPSWLLLALAAQAQVKSSRELGHGSGVLDSGVALQYKTVMEPAEGNSQVEGLGGGVFRARGSTMQHCLYDRFTTFYFGYAMTISPGATAGTRTVLFTPADTASMSDGLRAVAGDLPLNPAPLPKYPPPQIVRSGDTIAMDLMTNADGSERIVDYIHFSFGQSAPQLAGANATPRDFTIDDGAVQIDPNPPDVAIDSKKFAGIVLMYPPKSGKTLWAYFPGEGRFVLSLAPRAGLTKAGAVRGKRITFTWEGHEYEIRLSEPLAGLENSWNLYVMRDAAYSPRAVLVNAVVISADRLENLAPK